MKRKNLMCKFLLTIFMIFLCSCSKSVMNEQIIGYWMNSNAKTISFMNDKTCSMNDTVYTYTIYDKNHLQISSGDLVIDEYIFKFENGDLYIKRTYGDTYIKYTKDENRQQEIIKVVTEKQNKINEEAKRQDEIDLIRNEIGEYEKKINEENAQILVNEENIQKWKYDSESRIKQCEESIAFGDDRDYQENLRDDLISANNERIKIAEERIRVHKDNILKYENEIKKLEDAITRISQSN